MKVSKTILALSTTIIVVIMACGGDDTEAKNGIEAPAVPLVSLNDISDDGNSSDLQVAFTKASDESLISQYRVIIVPSGATISIDEADALEQSRSIQVPPNGQDQVIVLPQNWVDHLGDPIQENKGYHAYVVSVADGTNATLNSLSNISSEQRILSKLGRFEFDIENMAKAEGIQSMAIAALANGEVVWSKGYGINSSSSQVPTDEKTLYIASSISKLFVAVAVMQQVEQGKLDLDEDISTYLGFQVRNPNFPGTIITARSLLTHQSSLSNPNGTAVPEVNALFTDSVFVMENYVTSLMVQGQPLFNLGIWNNIAPNSVHSNSNYGVTVLAHLVEKTSGVNFRNYTRSNIFLRLGMETTAYRMSTTGFYDPSLLADSFSSLGGLVAPYIESAIFPAGWIRVSTEDLSKFFLAVLNGGQLDGKRILEESTVTEMLDVQFPNANLAFNSGVALMWRQYLNQWMGHTGGGIATHTTVIDPVSGKGIIILSNKRGAFAVSPDRQNGEIFERVEEFLDDFQ